MARENRFLLIQVLSIPRVFLRCEIDHPRIRTGRTRHNIGMIGDILNSFCHRKSRRPRMQASFWGHSHVIGMGRVSRKLPAFLENPSLWASPMQHNNDGHNILFRILTALIFRPKLHSLFGRFARHSFAIQARRLKITIGIQCSSQSQNSRGLLWKLERLLNSMISVQQGC